MRTVKNHLVARVSVDSAHDTALDGSVIVESLSHGSEAVCRAGSSGNDCVLFCKSAFVYAEYDCGKVVACGSGDNDFLCACVDVSLRFSLGAIEARAFENYVNVESLPGKVLSLGHSVDCDFLAVYRDGAGSNNCLAVFSKNGFL